MPFELRRRVRDAIDVLRLPLYRKYGPRQVEWSRVQRWVFVCHGNICRSPFGEAWARKQGVEATSCGIFAVGGAQADPGALACAAKLGVDLSGHRSKNIAALDLQAQDLVLIFDPSHIGACLRSAGSRAPQLVLVGVALPKPAIRIDDPFGRDQEYFQAVFHDTATAVDRLVLQSAAQ